MYCCNEFNILLENKNIRLFYNERTRHYSLATISYSGYQHLLYCFCCGEKFPKGLREIWYSILTEEYRIEDPWEAFYEGTLPPEFMTDEWWKKRGL